MTVTVTQPPRVDKVEQIATYRNIRRKVDNIEAQRIMYVFEQLQRRLLLLGKFFCRFSLVASRLKIEHKNKESLEVVAC